jgi:hypothetical protein
MRTSIDAIEKSAPQENITICRDRIEPKVNSTPWFSGTPKQSVVLNTQAFTGTTEYIPARVSGDICGSRSALSMRYQSSNQFAPKALLCPSCAQVMQLARITSRFDDLPELYTFECRRCDVSHIEAALGASSPRKHSCSALSS